MKLLVDLSSILGAYLHINDEEYGQNVTYKGKEFHIPHPETSFEKFQTSCRNLDIPITNFIVVMDPEGLPVSRTRIIETYKRRKRVQPAELLEAREQLFEMGKKWLLEQGAVVATPDKLVEADDLINQLSIRLPDTMIWTRDKDLLACPVDVILQGKDGPDINPEKFPVKDAHIHVYRTIVKGDPSDNIGSCTGFGEKAWQEMVEMFGEDSIQDLHEMLHDRELYLLKEHVELFPKFKKILDQEKKLYDIFKVLSFMPVPAHTIKWEGGMLRGTETLVTSDNYDQVLRKIKRTEFDYSVIDFEGDVDPKSRDWSKTSGVMVDVMAQRITGMGLRIGQGNYYFSTDHADTNNISFDQLETVLELLWGKPLYAHNLSFELTLIHNHFDVLFPNGIDTMLMSSYVDENDSQGLKNLSKRWLNYQQASYQDTLNGKSGMRELSGEEVLDYGLDDVITTDALKNLFEVIMMYEGTLDVFYKVECDALYFTTLCFINGMEFDQKAFDKLKRGNDRNIERTWSALSDKLLDLDWVGGKFRPLTSLNMGELNRVHKAVHGRELEDVTAVKMAIRLMDDRQLADMAENRDFDKINEYYHRHWKPTAEFNVRSPKQMAKLLYEVLDLPVRIRNPPTENMKKKNLQGNPASNEAAIQNAIAWDDTEHTGLLKLLLKYKGYLTKESLFLEKWPKYVHWKTGKIHASLRQSSTTTRRFTCSAPYWLGSHEGNFMLKAA